MTITTLDVSTLPRQATFTCQDGTEVDMFDLMDRVSPAIKELLAHDCVKISKTVIDQSNDSFGFAMAIPRLPDDHESPHWNFPETYVWFVFGWGPDRDKYIANAVRKLRPLLRENASSTLDMRFAGGIESFQNTVDSVNEDGTFPWGDFPWGGAVRLKMGDLTVAGAVSCYTQFEDDIVARLVVGLFAKKVMEAKGINP